jgi:hypothetical protein
MLDRQLLHTATAQTAARALPLVLYLHAAVSAVYSWSRESDVADQRVHTGPGSAPAYWHGYRVHDAGTGLKRPHVAPAGAGPVSWCRCRACAP